MSGKNRRLVAAGALAIAAGALFIWFLPVNEALAIVLKLVDNLGVCWGLAIFFAAYVVSAVLFLPGSVLTLGSGFLYGVAMGTVCASLGSTLGAAAAFYVGRTIARGWVERKVSAQSKFIAIDEAWRKKGATIVSHPFDSYPSFQRIELRFRSHQGCLLALSFCHLARHAAGNIPLCLCRLGRPFTRGDRDRSRREWADIFLDWSRGYGGNDGTDYMVCKTDNERKDIREGNEFRKKYSVKPPRRIHGYSIQWERQR